MVFFAFFPIFLRNSGIIPSGPVFFLVSGFAAKCPVLTTRSLLNCRSCCFERHGCFPIFIPWVVCVAMGLPCIWFHDAMSLDVWMVGQIRVPFVVLCVRPYKCNLVSADAVCFRYVNERCILVYRHFDS